MSKMVNSDMDAFWNGEGARKWLRLKDRMDKNLMRFGHEAMAAGADDLAKSHIASDLSHALSRYRAYGGIVLGAATWIVTARS